MSLDISKIAKDMFGAFKGELKDKWPEIKDYAETESKKLAQTLGMIEKLILSKKISEQQASLYMDIQKNATRAFMLTIEGLGILAVEAAIRAALNSVKNAVNTALGFALL